MKIYYTNIILTALLLLGCNKEPLVPNVVNELKFECPGDYADSYFEGEIEGKRFCYYDDQAEYEIEISKTSAFVTTEPSTSIPLDTANLSDLRIWANLGFIPKVFIDHINGTPLPHLKHYVLIETPSTNRDQPLAKIIKSNFTEIGDLLIQSDVVSNLEGFNIVFQFNDLDAGVSRRFETSGGNQDESFLRITDFAARALPSGATAYDITFEFACNLYYDGKPDQFYNSIDQARMKLSFIL